MAKKDKSDELEYLRGVIRQQKSEIKNLKRQLSRLEKRKHMFDGELDLDESDELQQAEKIEQEYPNHNKCPECGGKLESFDLGVRKLMRCECGYRKALKV